MVLQHVQTKQKQYESDTKKPSLTVAATRGRCTNPSKQTIRNKDRASTVSIRDVNLDDVKSMEPKWRSKKLDKITMVNDDQANTPAEERGATSSERKFTLQDFIVAGIRRRLSAKWRKKIGMHTSAYIVVPKPQPTVRHEPVAMPAIEEEVAAKSAEEVEYSETMEDDFVVISVY